MACRLPGHVTSPADLWPLVREGVDATTAFPTDRGWPLDIVAAEAARGGFLDAATEFDAALFGISPREALAMDPQQRLLLETAWEAFESAGIATSHAHGTPTGVFIGAAHAQYGVGMQLPDNALGHLMTGTTTSVASGRLAYTFGLEGPAVTVDTACSSSLVALHLAVQALRNGECEMALAGGVTVLATPGVITEFDRQRGLASDGRCKAFSSGADGTGMSEGVGLLLVERLSDAERLGHEVLAVVRGSAVNQDGASNGLTAPNGPSQERVIRQALANARLTAPEVDAVEAHGTGTKLGDPIEAQAILATYGQGRDADRPLWLGSVKSNIGHTQAAAGVAGVIKMVLAMRNEELPPTLLHTDEPTTHVDWSAGAVELLTEARPWPRSDRPRRAGVSSFGISGTNAHVILEAAAPAPSRTTPTPPPGPVSWLLSAHTPQALRAQAERLVTTLTETDTPAHDVAWSLATTRTALDHRAAVIGDGHSQLLAGLTALAGGDPAANVVPGTVREGRTAFLFTGQGAQRAGMGRGLYETFPVYADAFDAVCAELEPHLERPVRDVVFGGDGLDETVWAQAGLFAVEVAVFRLLESWGAVPDVLLGHSVGEIAAAHCAGILTLADACELVAVRGRLMQALPAGGAMLAVEATEEEVSAGIQGRLDIAAVNGPTSVVVSGDTRTIEEFAGKWSAQGRRTSRLTVSHAFHSALMEPMLAEFAKTVEPMTFAEPRIPVVPAMAGADPATPDYWIRQVRETVRFADGVRQLTEHGATRFVEVGPDGVLCTLAQQSLPDAVFAPVLRRDRDEHETALTALGRLWATGSDIDWPAVLPTGRPTTLPTYAFQRERYWPQPQTTTHPATPADADETRFWAAVDRADLTELADTINLPDASLHLNAVIPALSQWRRSRHQESVIGSWRYRVTWTPLNHLTSTTATLSGTWLVAAAPADAEQAARLADALRAAGAEATLLDRETGRQEPGAPADVTGVIALAPSTDTVTESVALLKRLDDMHLDAPLWMLTSGAVSIGRSDPLRQVTQAQAWGLGRVAALEQPHRWGGLIDLPAELDDRATRILLSVLAGDTDEDQIAVRTSGAYGRRLARATADEPTTTPYTPTGTIVITGGTGALGTHVARWLAERGAPHLLLLGRRGPDTPNATGLTDELAAHGTQVTIAACDVTDRTALAAVLDTIPAQHPLTGIVHAAGAGQAVPLADTDETEITRVLDVKTTAAAHLDELTRTTDLDLFVVFSSIAATWGSGGQGVYAAANAHLDALVEQRRAHGRSGTSVAWGPWEGDGMAGRDGAEAYLHRHGLNAMAPDLAIRALQRAVELDESCVTVADVDWQRFAPAFTSGRNSALLTDLPEATTALAPTPTTPTDRSSTFRDELTAAPESRRHGMLLDLIRARTAVSLGHTSPEAIEPERSFRDLGFDSLTAVELRNLLGTDTGLALPATLVFDHPNPTALAEHLAAELLEHTGPATQPTTTIGAVDDAIAIVGMSARYPGGVRNAEQLWDLVAHGIDGITEFPADRGWPSDVVTGTAARGGFVDDATQFDAALFGISPREALAMDPQQRLLLEAAWEAFESAGLNPRSLRGRPVGVFAGASASGYGGPGDDLEGADGYRLVGTANSVISGRVAYTFGLEGPAVTVDTACSSSLVALHWAAQALRNGECEMALAGGVTVMVSPAAFAEFDRQDGLASDGRCKSFAASADGTGWGEGVGVLVLERLSDARRNGHEILAVVRGSAVNQDGASNGLTAPNGPSQQRVIRQALATAGLTPNDVDAVEAHGTGTRLGDPIEAQALLAAYGQDRDDNHPLWLGSIKSNIGHTQAASGVAGVIKMVMAMRHGILPATLHADEPTPHVDWTTGAVKLLTEARPWTTTGRPRRAGVSSFGISGTNAHIVLENAPTPDDEAPAPARTPHPLGWTLSAKTADALRAQAARLRGLMTQHHTDLHDVAWSLATTRAALDHRAAVIGTERDELLTGLAALADGSTAPHTHAAEATQGRTAFLFTGQGAQRAGMGRGLYETFPVYADAFDAVCAELEPHLERPVRDVVFDGDGLDETVWAQAGLFAVEVAVFRLLESWGVAPDVLLGHSVGEIAAAHCAGVFSLTDACRLVAARGRLMQALPAGGAMLAVEATEAEATATTEGRLDIAAVNGPTSVVVSGDTRTIDEFAATWSAQGRRTSRLTVSHAFHSALMEPMLAEFATVLKKTRFAEPRIPLVSNLTGRLAEPGLLSSPDYWVRQVRETVRFADGIDALRQEGTTRLVELGPDAVLCGMAQQTDIAATTAPILRADRDDTTTALQALARLWTHGANTDWSALAPAGRRTTLPTYPFQRDRYWPRTTAATQPAPHTTDSRFWDAIEHQDIDALADLLDNPSTPDLLGAALPMLSTWRRHQQKKSAVDSWRYLTTWRPIPDLPTTPALTGRWLVITPENQPTPAPTHQLSRALTDAGAETIHLTPTSTDRSALAAQLAEAGPVSGVISLAAWADDATPHPETPAALHLTLRLLQALGDAEIDAPLWALTTGAVSVGPSDTAPAPQPAQIWGLGRVAAREHPDRWGGLLDIPAVLDTRAGARLTAILGGDTGEDQIAVRAAGVYGRRLVRAETTDNTPWSPSRPGTVLVTGGTGALGTMTARWLSDRGVPHIVLIGRRGTRAPGIPELVAELANRGTQVTVETGDITDRTTLTGVLERLPAQHPLIGVVHAAGTLDDGTLDTLTPERFQTVLAAKASGLVALDEATHGAQLDFFVAFSSLAATLGSAGQGNYAAANAFVDAWMHGRRHRGLPGTSIAWGPWAQDGMAAGDQTVTDRLRRGGLSPLDPELALTALAGALTTGDQDPMIADIDWPRYAAALTATRPSPLLTELPEAASARTPATNTTPATQLRAELTAAPAGRRHALLLAAVRTWAATVLGHDSAEAVGAGQAFRDLGFDSLAAVELRNLAGTSTGLRLPASLVFDHPTPTELAQFLGEQLPGNEQPRTPATQTPTRTTTEPDEPLALVGMACRLPGGVGNPDELWDLLIGKVDAMTTFPTDRRWDLTALPGSLALRGGFVDGAAEFDAGLFGISPREAMAMDPQQRLLLETVWETFESAGIDPHAVRGRSIGMFVGTNGQDYPVVLAGSDDQGLDAHTATGNAAAVLSGRVSYAFGLEGPALTIDTACSSSLVALHLAAQALRRGECDLALAGGVSIMSTAAAFTEFARQGGLANDGRCKAFSADADGTGWGEGVGVLLVERLSDARRNGHEILAVVRGSAVNQDGASNGLTAPNGPSQQRVIRQALADARLSPTEVDAVEAHGTGTKLGDPIEAQALLATYGQDRDTDRPLWLGSIKSNIGHTQAAAGVAGVIKMVMALRHGTLPPTLHADEPTTQVDWSAGAVELLTQTRPWPETGRPRRAGVSSFGISGTNAHIILEAEPAPAEQQPPTDHPADGTTPPWLISGRTATALAAQAGRLHDTLSTHPEPATDIARSLLSRADLQHRAVVTGDGYDDLLTGLTALATGQPATDLISETTSEGRTAFLFTGQGAQRAGMGRGLYETFPVYADAFDAVCAELEPHLERPVRDVVFGGDGLDETVWAQAGLFAVEVAVFRLLESWGAVPDVLLGHSVGEIAAAHCAGILTLADACELVAVRGRLMQALPAGGAMLAVEATEEEVSAGIQGRLDIAAVNGPTSVVVSGDTRTIEEFAGKWSAQGRRTSRLTVSHAFHSALMEPMLAEFAKTVEPMAFADPRIPVVPAMAGADPATPEYWIRQVRETVRFADGVRQLTEHGATRFVEVGPDGVLCAMTRQSGATGTFAPVLRRDRDEVRTAWAALGRIWAVGADVDWAAAIPAHGRQITLPTYAFQRDRYWPEPANTTPAPAPAEAPGESRFWAAVERQDATEIAGTLRLTAPPEALTEVLPALSSWRRQSQQHATVNNWRYRVEWTAVTTPAATLDGTWLLVTETGDDNSTDIEDALRTAGADVLPLTIDATHPDRRQLATQLAAAAADNLRGVVHAAGHQAELALALTLVQALGDAELTTPLWTLTRGAVAIDTTDHITRAEHARLWGFGQAVALEHPQRWGGLIDLPTDGHHDLTQLAAALSGDTEEDQIALRNGRLHARRLVRADQPDPAAPAWAPSRPGTVLVTGGTGALGASVARWLAERGVSHLLLTSRRGAQAPGADELIAELRTLGAHATITHCDVADRNAVSELLTAVPADRPLIGIVHAAGVAQSGPVATTRLTDITKITDGKMLGATHLDQLTEGADLELFVVFSSIAATWGSGGQALYAAGNAYLDALAERRAQHNLAATSVAWGPWADAGMAVSGEAEEFLRRRGLAPLDPSLAIAALAQAIDGGETNLTVADVDWTRFAPAFTSSRPSPLLRELPEATNALAPTDPPTEEEADTGLRARLATLNTPERLAELTEVIRSALVVVLRYAAHEQIDSTRPFQNLGFDSLTAVEFRDLLARQCGTPLPSTIVFDYPTPAALADHLHATLPGADPATDIEPLIGALDTLEAAMADSPPDGLSKARVTVRLQAFLDKWTTDQPAAENTATDRIQAADDDELISLIRDQLGDGARE
ncbi:type I polyketide synthase [Streptomyces parvus]